MIFISPKISYTHSYMVLLYVFTYIISQHNYGACRISVGSVGYYGYFTIFEKLRTKMKKKKVVEKLYYGYFSVFPPYHTLPSFPTPIGILC
jgi:hypothetical protein